MRADRGAHRSGPPAQCMHDRAQGQQGPDRRLIPVSRGDQPHRAAIKVWPFVARQFLKIVERVLDQPGNRPVIARSGDQQAICPAHRFDQFGPVGQGVIGAAVVRQTGQIRPAEHFDRCSV